MHAVLYMEASSISFCALPCGRDGTGFQNPHHSTSMVRSLSTALVLPTMPSRTRLHALLCLFILPFLLLIDGPSVAASGHHSRSRNAAAGFSVRLIHRDSPLSPLYDPLRNPSDRLAAIRSRTFPNNADHLMQFSIGTPPVQVHAEMDTGSDLVWAHCRPCADCNDPGAPIFDPGASSSYRALPCNSTQCKSLLLQTTCNGAGAGDEGSCGYTYGYGDSSVTAGVLATETFTFDATDGGSVPFPGMVFGCSHNNGSIVGPLVGLVGLGAGPASLISQLGPSIAWKFSYCLVPFEESASTSTMSFGSMAVVSGAGAVSTPLVPGEDPTFYYVTLEAITVGDETVKASPGAPSSGNMIVDCGTTMTMLDTDVFRRLSAVLNAKIGLPPTTDPGKSFLCYEAESRDGLPDVTFHFAGGADMVLRPMNAFTAPSPEGLVCLAMLPTDDITLLGNMAQQNFHIGYDLANRMFSFAPAECSTLSN